MKPTVRKTVQFGPMMAIMEHHMLKGTVKRAVCAVLNPSLAKSGAYVGASQRKGSPGAGLNRIERGSSRSGVTKY